MYEIVPALASESRRLTAQPHHGASPLPGSCPPAHMSEAGGARWAASLRCLAGQLVAARAALYYACNPQHESLRMEVSNAGNWRLGRRLVDLALHSPRLHLVVLRPHHVNLIDAASALADALLLGFHHLHFRVEDVTVAAMHRRPALGAGHEHDSKKCDGGADTDAHHRSRVEAAVAPALLT
eukprot:2955464-Prymnesium_polylepis.1